jgi:hypothetical protein
MSRRLMVFFAAIVFGGTNVSSAADLSKAGGNWDQEASIALVSTSKWSIEKDGQIRPVGLLESSDVAPDRTVETTMIGHQGGCCPGAPCDWLSPCGGLFAEFQAVWLRAQFSESDNDVGNKYDPGTRYILGHIDNCGRIWRGRYFNYFTRTPEDAFKLEYADFEHARRFAWAGGLYGELSAGLRWAEFQEQDDLLFSETIGPVIGAELRGLSIVNWDAYASARHSIQFGHERAENFLGSFSITELQLGMVRNVNVLGHSSFVKGFFEAQNWAAPQDDSSTSIGLVGLGLGIGTSF